jgi:hypothetical protein
MGDDLLLDYAVIITIFPDIKPADMKMLTDCTMRCQFDTAPPAGMSQDLIVRVGTLSGKFEAVRNLQALARTQIPDLVPETYTVGTATRADGKAVEYSVSQFVPDTVTLESVWPSLHPAQQYMLMDTVITALMKIHQLDKQSMSLGGPHAGHASSMRDFLTQVVAHHQMEPRVPPTIKGKVQDHKELKPQATSSVIEGPGGITIKSALSELGEITFSDGDLAALESDAVLCHSDMEPCNILVRRIADTNATDPQYEVAAIIDWEMAGFFPFAFEIAFKDVELGSSNLHLDWYTLFKARTQTLIVPGENSTKLIKAVRLIVDSRCMQWKKKVGVEFTRRWIKQEGLELHRNPYLGWVPGPGARRWKFSKEQNDELELQIAKEFGYVS